MKCASPTEAWPSASAATMARASDAAVSCVAPAMIAVRSHSSRASASESLMVSVM